MVHKNFYDFSRGLPKLIQGGPWRKKAATLKLEVGIKKFSFGRKYLIVYLTSIKNEHLLRFSSESLDRYLHNWSINKLRSI